MITGVPVFWHKSSNFGDALTPWLVKKITGMTAIWSEDYAIAKYMITGSILNDPVSESCIVWGAGIAYSNTSIKKPLEIRAVRGPLTRAVLRRLGLECPESYGDPGLLVPRFYKGNTQLKKYQFGIIPHVIDYDKVMMNHGERDDILIINANLPVEEVIDKIIQCDALLSSSLHGIIVSHAYGKPCRWVKFSNNILGDDTKYRDYYLSTGQTEEFIDLRHDNYELDDIFKSIPDKVDLNIDLDLLYNSCPLK